MTETPTREGLLQAIDGLEDAAAWRSDLVVTYRAQVVAAFDALTARIAELEGEVDEFNAGFDAFRAGLSPDDEPDYTVHDAWRVGYAWAAYDTHIARIADLEAALDAAIKDRDWHSEQLDRRSERIAELEAERDAARAEAQARLEGREKRCCTW